MLILFAQVCAPLHAWLTHMLLVITAWVLRHARPHRHLENAWHFASFHYQVRGQLCAPYCQHRFCNHLSTLFTYIAYPALLTH